MKIQKITVTNLFGYLNHEITFEEGNNISILLGDNGIGKTTILHIIEYVFSSRFDKLLQIDFEKILIVLGQRTYLQLQHVLKNDRDDLEISVRAGNLSYGNYYSSIRERIQNRVEDLRAYVNRYYTRVSSSKWIHDKTQTSASVEDVFFYLLKHISNEILDIHKVFPPQILFVTEKIQTIFIGTNRLYPNLTLNESLHKDEEKDVILQCSNDFVERVRTALSKGADQIATYDSSYAKRLISKLTNIKDNKEQFDYDLAEKVELKQNRLYRLGLLPYKISSIDINQIDFNPSVMSALNLYYADVWEKLKVYDNLLDETELFMEIINEFYGTKVAMINNLDGFFVKNTTTATRVPLSSLSSGEKHLFVLMYKLIFMEGKDVFVLIDEPELSLHITWQRLFLNALNRITMIKGQEYLLATHSPSIIGSEWDKTIQL